MARFDANNPILTAALEYLELGFALLPITPGTKKPYGKLLPKDSVTGSAVWKPLGLRPVSELEVRDWFRRAPDCNIGVICGAASNNLVVVDFDGCTPEGWDLPQTPAVKTSRGTHLYYRSNTAVKSRKITDEAGQAIGEVRSEGNYVVTAPSVHPDGTIYRWINGHKPCEVGFAEPPPWVLRDGRVLSESSITASEQPSNEHPSNEHPSNEHPSNEELSRQTIDPYALLGRGGIQLVRGQSLIDWAKDPESVRLVANKLGIPADAATPMGIGKAFCCVLPGHKERSPSASLFEADKGVIVYRDWHHGSGDEWFLLAEVRAAQAYGRPVKLAKPELAVWQLRLLVETGLMLPAEVPMPELPVSASASARKVYDGFRLLLGCKWLHSPGEPTPFSWRFARAWCGVSEWVARTGIKELLAYRVVRIVGKHRAGAFTMDLFLPG